MNNLSTVNFALHLWNELALYCLKTAISDLRQEVGACGKQDNDVDGNDD